ncbi:aspartoacylase [Kangiella profundi]|nr:aspartoacylase [Kangiella profundi]
MSREEAREMVNKVVIVGGTHGNEYTGVYLLEKYHEYPHLLKPKTFELEYLLANPEAFKHNRRYLDRDLNRSFKQSDLKDPLLSGYENARAKEINDQLGPKGDARVDMIIDLHTSTAPMGVNLVLTQTDTFHLMLVDYVQQRMNDVTVTLEKQQDHHFLMTVADRHVLVEVGPVPQGQLKHEVFEKTEQAVQLIAEFIEHYNQHRLPQPSESIDIYEYFGVMYLPTDPLGNICGMVHKNIQDRDFQLLKSGEPIFHLFNGEDEFFEGEDCTISFINEAAYYDEKKAFSMSKKQTYHIG